MPQKSPPKKIKHFDANDDMQQFSHKNIKKTDDFEGGSESFKKTMQWLLEDRNISEAELARLTNVSAATIHRLIYGITDPRLSTLKAIASFFKIRIEQLIGDYPIPSVTQVGTNNSEKILFSTPILIPFIEWEFLPKEIDIIGELTMSNWANWHATANEVDRVNSSDYFATKLVYTAGDLLHAESILVVKTMSVNEKAKIGDCVIAQSDNQNLFIGQISGSGNEISIKGGNSADISNCKIYGVVVKCEIPMAKIARYTDFIELK